MKRHANNIVLEFTQGQAEMFTELAGYLKQNYPNETVENAICDCFLKDFKNVADEIEVKRMPLPPAPEVLK